MLTIVHSDIGKQMNKVDPQLKSNLGFLSGAAGVGFLAYLVVPENLVIGGCVGAYSFMLGRRGFESRVPLKIVRRGETIELHQRQWAVTTGTSKRPILASPNITNCIGFYGIDRKNQIGFMGHFDTLESIDAVPDMFNSLRALVADIPQHEFSCHLLGGICFGGGLLGVCSKGADKRQKVMDYVREEMNSDAGLNITLPKSHLYNNQKSPLGYLKSGWEVGIKLDVRCDQEHSEYPKVPVLRKEVKPPYTFIRNNVAPKVPVIRKIWKPINGKATQVTESMMEDPKTRL